jgi:bifunctional DNA-binding transcriptional regulator/antitoxin component of YhaV-PrlF toxin-antitoxin module
MMQRATMFGDEARERLVSQSRHGRVTIPIAFRRALGIEGAPVLEMRLVGDELHIRRLAVAPMAGGTDASRGSERGDDDGDTGRQEADAHDGSRRDPGDGDAVG